MNTPNRMPELDSTIAALQTQIQHQAFQHAEYNAHAAHALRNAFGVIHSVADVLTAMGDQLTPSRRDRYLHRMLGATTHLDHLIESISTYSYIAAGKLDGPIVALDLVQFGQDHITLTQTKFTAGHALVFRAQAKICPIVLDPALLTIALDQLIHNAVQYSPVPAPQRIDICLTWDDRNIQFKVQDQGIGIPIDQQVEVFQPFVRGDNVKNCPDDLGGAGLGLAIAQAAIQRQGGQISLQSNLDYGSCFTLALPRTAGNHDSSVLGVIP
jgi:signal transduction histidine kinase